MSTEVANRPTNVVPTDAAEVAGEALGKASARDRAAKKKSKKAKAPAEPKQKKPRVTRTPGQRRASADERARKYEEKAATIRAADARRRAAAFRKAITKAAVLTEAAAALAADEVTRRAILGAAVELRKVELAWVPMTTSELSELEDDSRAAHDAEMAAQSDEEIADELAPDLAGGGNG